MFILPSNRPIEFVPESFKDQDNPPIFLIQAPTKSLVLETQSLLAGASMIPEQSGNTLNTVMRLCLDNCVTGWKNIVDDTGKPIDFTKENFERLNNQDILMGIYLKIQELTAGTEKNE